MIPWDLDLDIAIHQNHRPILKTILSNLGTIFDDTTEDIMKFTLHNGSRYLDIFSFYNINTTHIHLLYNHTHKYDYKYMILEKKLIWPLQLRPYAGMWLLAPARTLELLELWYGDLEVCVIDKPPGRQGLNIVECEALDGYHPRVVRLGDGSEALVYENRQIYRLYL